MSVGTTFAFWKMAGGGNDFIVLDGVTTSLPPIEPERVRRWCRRGLSIGADGVIAVTPSGSAQVRMLHWNSDGGANPYCGNGTRCVARFAVESALAGPALRIETGAGIMQAEVEAQSGRVSVQVPRPRDLRRGVRVSAHGRSFAGGFVLVGVPHFVTEVDDLASLDVASVGAALRSHAEFGEAGANIDFIRRAGEGIVEIRTYERGVEAETLSCGSGAIAAAVWLGVDREERGSVLMRTRSGVELGVRNGGTAREPVLWLAGDARIIYTGTATGEAAEGFPA